MIAVAAGRQASFLGEVWYTEADRPEGPWIWARKIVTHDRYRFYNPVQHPFFDQDGGRVIYFEGTYTYTFSGNDDPTPRYDYNQVMYRLDLGDPRLKLPCKSGSLIVGDIMRSLNIAFMHRSVFRPALLLGLLVHRREDGARLALRPRPAEHGPGHHRNRRHPGRVRLRPAGDRRPPATARWPRVHRATWSGQSRSALAAAYALSMSVYSWPSDIR